MPRNPETTEDHKRPLKVHANSDLVEEIKTRIMSGELKETLLFDADTCRIYSDLEMDSRRLFRPEAVMSLVFPASEFDPDSLMHQRLAKLLFDLSDEDFSTLRSAVRAETEEALRRLVAHLKSLDPDDPSGAKDELEPSDD